MDNTVIVWNAASGERIATLRAPRGGQADRPVKGLAWDPIGRFLATQDENTLRVWQTDKWECVRVVDEPFKGSTGTSLFARLDWTRDGQYLLCPCAMNSDTPTVRTLTRAGNESPLKQTDLIGFRKAVACIVSLIRN